MVIILFETKARKNLYPLSQLYSIADLRFGIFTIKERWEAITGLPVYIRAENYLSDLYENYPQDSYLLIDASLKDDDALRALILSLQTGEGICDDYGLVAGKTEGDISSLDVTKPKTFFKNFIDYTPEKTNRLFFPWQIFHWNDEQLRKDFLLLFARSTTQTISETNKVIQPENVIIEEGAVVEHCFINASTGPVFIGKNATVMEGAMLRGPVAVCENAVVKMGTKIYGATTISPYCTVGGEIKNSVLQSYSNKAHDGYLGDSVIGSWCNLGAGTSNSNVKNTAGDINIWDEELHAKFNVGKKFGVIMGDYTRTAINTSINSGTLIGICCNILGAGLTPKIINNFSWGINNAEDYHFEKAIEHINNWKAFKGRQLSSAETSALKHIFDKAAADAQQIKDSDVAINRTEQATL